MDGGGVERRRISEDRILELENLGIGDKLFLVLFKPLERPFSPPGEDSVEYAFQELLEGACMIYTHLHIIGK